MKTPQYKMIELNLDDYENISWDSLITLFSNQAKKEGWSKDEIKSVIKEATKYNDYVHLVETIREYCKY